MVGFLAVTFLLELLFSGYEKYRLYNALENLILAIGLLSFCRLIFPKKQWPLFQVIICIFTLLIVLLEGAYFLILDAVFSPSAILIAMETNVSETLEFAQDYFSFNVLFYVFVILAAGIFMISYEALRSSDLNFKWLYYVGVLGAIIGLRHPLIYPQNLPFTLSTGVIDYWATSSELNKQKANKYGGFTDVGADLSGDELYVFVIGESTNRNHMQIYGYNRETNPKLTALQDELTIFKDVISSHAYTIASLTRALRLTDKIKDGNISNKQEYSKFSGLRTEEGDVVSYFSPSGGGFGNPLERDTSMVLDDVLDEIITPAMAKSDYGVVLTEVDDGYGWKVNETETARLRSSLT